MTEPDNLWAERHPSVHIVADELRRIKHEKALATIRERQQFVNDLTAAMKQNRKFRDTRIKQKRVGRVSRRTFVANFTLKQTLLAEKILNDLANQSDRNS